MLKSKQTETSLLQGRSVVSVLIPRLLFAIFPASASGGTPLLLLPPILQGFRIIANVLPNAVKLNGTPHDVVEALLLPHLMNQRRSAILAHRCSPNGVTSR